MQRLLINNKEKKKAREKFLFDFIIWYSVSQIKKYKRFIQT